MSEPRAVRLFRRVLRLTSAEFRVRDGDDLVQVFAELHRDAVARAGWRGGFGALLAELPRLLRLAWLTHRSAWRVASSPEGSTMNDIVIQDLRHAVRALVRRPVLAVPAVITLTLGIGASITVFSVVNAVLLRPLPYPDSDRLVYVWSSAQSRNIERGPTSVPD